MLRNISCFCDNTFSVNIPGEIDLDEDPSSLDQILEGSFFTFICPRCEKKHKPEFPLFLRWPQRNLILEVLPEADRKAFYRRNTTAKTVETVIGYPEMAERLACHRDRLVPAVIEALKYYMLLKAEETWPGEDLGVWYQRREEAGGLEFHLHGFKNGEIAVSRLPPALYEKTLEDFRKRPKGGIFPSLRFRSYISMKNVALPEDKP